MNRREFTKTMIYGSASLSLPALLALPAGAEQRRAAPAAMAGMVYTADEHGKSISVINLAEGTVRTVPVAISPHNVQTTADGRQLLAVGEPTTEAHGHGAPASGHGKSEARGLLLIFDVGKLASGPAVSITVGAHPAHVVVDRAGAQAFVTNSGDNSIAVIDLKRKNIVRTVRVGRYPHGLRISPDGHEVYVANVEDGSVSVIDTTTLAEVARIPVGRAPVQVGFTPDGAQVYVSLRDENSVAIIDTVKRAKTAAVAVGRAPIQVHATPDGRFVFVANQGSETEPADTVSVIEVASGRVVDTIRTGKGAHGVAVSDDGALVFVTNIVDGTVAIVDAASRSVIETFHVGRGPNGVTFSGRDG